MSAPSRSQPSRGRRAFGAALAALLLALALSGPAHAAEVPNHPFIKALIDGVEEEPKPEQAVLEAPCGVAVNPEGSIFVSEYYRQKIVGTVLPDYYPKVKNGPCALASDGENLYVNYWHSGVVNLDFGLVDPGPATGIAVDPTTRDLYVDRRTSIAVYDAPVHSDEEPAMEIGTGSLKDGYGVAVSAFAGTAGDVYVGDAADNTVKVYDPAKSLVDPVQVIDGAGTAAGRFVSLTDASLAIEQATGHVFVVDDVQPDSEHSLVAVDEFNAEGIYRGQLEHEIVDGEPTGIAVDESVTESYGQIYVTSGNGSSAVISPEAGPPESEQGKLFAFGPAGPGQSIEVTTSGPGQGSVTSNPAGIACPGACKAELNSGAVVNLTATPASGSAFAGWSGACSGTGACQVTLNSATTIAAEFTLAPVPGAANLGATGAKATLVQTGPSASGPGALKLGRAIARANGTVSLQASLPGPGTLSATGNGLKRAAARSGQAGPITLRLRLDRAGRRALAQSKAGALALRVALAFSPSPGQPASVLSKTVTFK